MYICNVIKNKEINMKLKITKQMTLIGQVTEIIEVDEMCISRLLKDNIQENIRRKLKEKGGYIVKIEDIDNKIK